jgi:hypothetical protein
MFPTQNDLSQKTDNLFYLHDNFMYTICTIQQR